MLFTSKNILALGDATKEHISNEFANKNYVQINLFILKLRFSVVDVITDC